MTFEAVWQVAGIAIGSTVFTLLGFAQILRSWPFAGRRVFIGLNLGLTAFLMLFAFLTSAGRAPLLAYALAAVVSASLCLLVGWPLLRGERRPTD